MKHTYKLLLYTFISIMLLCVLFVAANESGLLVMACDDIGATTEFYMLMAMELASVCLIPLALWMFRAKAVKRRLAEEREKALLPFGLARIGLLALPMATDIVFYYLTMIPSFAYLAIIHFLAMFFIFPSKERCVSEVAA